MQSESRTPEARRRWTRKGTRSCWECKRRKIRCTYASPTDTVCTGCTRRCTKCVGQEFPDQATTATARSRLVGDRIGRVEAMVKELVKQTGSAQANPISAVTNPSYSTPSEDAGPGYDILTPATSDTPTPYAAPSHYPSSVDKILTTCFYETEPEGSLNDINSKSPGTNAQPLSNKFEKLSEALLAAYPPEEDVKLIIKCCGKISTYFYQVLGTPYSRLQDNASSELEKLGVRYTSATHPILIARQMLKLAAVLQYNNPDIRPELKSLSESPRHIMRRLAETATRLVTADDRMVGTIEGLECIMLEGVYQGNNGNLRRCWLSWRRAIGVAQLMCLQRPNRPPLESIEPISSLDPQTVWHRIVYIDRFISLMLGLPQATHDTSMASESALSQDTLMGQFERRQCIVASQILDRNELDPSSDIFANTQEIDTELQRIAATMPSKWWLPPNLGVVQNMAAEESDEQLFMEMNRVFNQIYHYNLLNQLHLPFMLHTSSCSDLSRHEYSRITCVNASRDLLSRYVTFRSFNRVAFCCRVIDFFALMATLTLLLAHIHAHRTFKHAGNVLIHQRLSDRGMMDQVLENMEALSSINEDILSCKSAKLLRQLLAIEADAAQGSSHCIGDGITDAGDTGKLRVWVPYLGTVSIAPNGDITKEVVDQPRPTGYGSTSPASKRPQHQDQDISNGNRSGEAVLPLCQEGGASSDISTTGIHQPSGGQSSIQNFGRPDGSEIGRAVLGNLEAPVLDSAAQHILYPGVTASADQWAFQGVDSTFFDTLMRETGNQADNSGSSWWLLSGT